MHYVKLGSIAALSVTASPRHLSQSERLGSPSGGAPAIAGERAILWGEVVKQTAVVSEANVGRITE